MKVTVPTRENIHITIVGLGYVGLPLAIEFGKKYPTTGFDINKLRIEELRNGFDRTMESEPLIPINENEEVRWAEYLNFSDNLALENDVDKELNNIYIITVPTPIDKFKKPNLNPLISASSLVAKVLKRGDVIIYESTVYPGCTEEDCVPVLEMESGLKFNEEFYCGYSPERINPGDKLHTVAKIKKVTSGSTPAVASFVDELYASIIEAGTFKASNIRVAEAAKVIENCQRDINIAFINELALIFNQMNIDTASVLEAASTKWNFLNFKPGLVGGHCIGVDPYYLTYKAESLGYHPQVILSGRRINDNMGKFVASEFIKLLIRAGSSVNKANVLVLGITFKENCPDIRNSKVIDIISELSEYGCTVDVYDPWADSEEVELEYSLSLIDTIYMNKYRGIIHAVSHQDFIEPFFINELKTFEGVIYDVKSSLPKHLISNRL